MGYCAAKYQLAEAAYQAYADEGNAARIDEAFKLYEAADLCGYSPAVERLAEIAFSADDFEVPKVVQALYDGDFDTLNKARPLVALYLQGFHDFMSLDVHPGGSTCPGVIAQAAIGYNLEGAVNGDSEVAALGEVLRAVSSRIGALGAIGDSNYFGDLNKYRDYYRALGRRDAQHLVAVYTCEGIVTQNLYDQIVVFAAMKNPVSLKDLSDIRSNAVELFGPLGVAPAIPNAPNTDPGTAR